ncbi:MAG: hypothetical protein HY700_00045 [Gemmatimonadetes bacterium]|nr:hypothetical protein [Gemmatimonadota bacterium]
MKDWLSRKVRFVKATLHRDEARSRASVELERPGSGSYIGTADGPASDLDDFRAGAQAAAQAVQQAADSEDARVEVRGLELIKAVGETVVIVSVSASFGKETRALFGVCQVHDDPASAAAMAVLNATNRVFDLA